MYDFKILNPGDDISLAIALRKDVFCDEQGYSHSDEFDDLDNSSTHVLVFDKAENILISYGRIIDEGNGVFRLGRICVKKSFRSKHIGQNLMLFMIDFVKANGGNLILIGAQIRVKGFYESLGFEAYDDVYMDVHVPHIKMKLVCNI